MLMKSGNVVDNYTVFYMHCKEDIKWVSGEKSFD